MFIDPRLPTLLHELHIEHLYEPIPDIDHNLTKRVRHVGTRNLQFADRHFAQQQ